MLRRYYFDTTNRTYFSASFVALLALVLLGASGYAYTNLTSLGQNTLRSTQPAGSSGPYNSIISEKDEEKVSINVAQNATPAVVSIVASEKVSSASLCRETQNLPQEIQRYFNLPEQCPEGSTVQQDVGAGTGFLVSPDGYIITNKHVVQDTGAEYNVILNDRENLGKKLKGRVVARSKTNDIAIVKVEANDLPYLSFGDSGGIQVGQTVLAIGYALGEYDSSVSKGIISGLSRSISAGNVMTRNVERLRGLIQTDAAINPGDSGGPLLDLNGKVIGVNVAMAEGQNIGFAIPSNEVKTAYEQMRSSGKITGTEKAFLGVRYTPITTEIQSTKKLPYNYGMLVTKGENNEPAAQVNSPAYKAGIVENDVILELDGKQLNERYTLADAVENKKPGDTVSLLVYHEGKEKTVELQLASVTL